jgi:predicted RNA-binding protein with TRAM domain
LGDNKPNSSQSLNLSDCTDCGLVYRCLKANQYLTNREIAQITKLPIWSVIRFRAIVENELGLPKNSESQTNLQLKQAVEKVPILPSLQSHGKRFVVYKKHCPVNVTFEYTAKISKIGPTGLGVAFICDFPCQISDVGIGDLVKFRVEKIGENFAYGKVIQIVQENKTAKAEKQQIQETKVQKADRNYFGKRCLDCNFPITEELYDLHDGLCAQCYYNKIQSDEAKGERRSGIFGSDRAGTY